MKAIEFINEAMIDRGIGNHLRDKGYKKIGSGADQSAWLEPNTGLILKIFGTAEWSTAGELTKAQRAFKKFADYCMANQNNPFLPQFLGWEKFEYKGSNYLQIRCERLFEFSNKGKTQDWARELALIAEWAGDGKTVAEYIKFRESKKSYYEMPESQYRELMTYIGGEDKLALLWNTIKDLNRIAHSGEFNVDLHPGNFMLGSDGHIVISDPFYTGY